MALFIDREALIRSGSTVPSSRTQVSARAAWKTPGVSTTFRGRRGQSIVVDDSVRDVLDQLLEAVNPAVAAATNRNFAPVAERAFEKWPAPPPGPPKRTGLSKSLLSLEVTVSPDGSELAASIINEAPYALFIDRSRLVRNLIWTPGEAAADAMADEIAEEIAE